MAAVADPRSDLMSDPPSTAADVARGVCRLLHRSGAVGLTEVPLGNNRRADIFALDEAGRITIVEIKISMGDLRGDAKWPEYLDYCDRFFWAVPEAFPLAPFEDAHFMPDRSGLIVADRYDAAVLRPAPYVALNAARRKAETLRFARRAAQRLLWIADPHLTSGG